MTSVRRSGLDTPPEPNVSLPETRPHTCDVFGPCSGTVEIAPRVRGSVPGERGLQIDARVARPGRCRPAPATLPTATRSSHRRAQGFEICPDVQLRCVNDRFL